MNYLMGFLVNTAGGGAIADPKASAPDKVVDGVNLALGLVKYLSLAAIVAVFVASGVIVLAGNSGHGTGMTPELKSKMGGAVIALIIVASAVQIVNFFA